MAQFLSVEQKNELKKAHKQERYERGSLIITSNRVFKEWPKIFNNDSTLTSAILDRLLHHAETVVIEGKSYRRKDRIES